MADIDQAIELDLRTGTFFRHLVERSARCDPRRFRRWSLKQLAALISCDTAVWYLAGRDGRIGSSTCFMRHERSCGSPPPAFRGRRVSFPPTPIRTAP